MGRPNWGVTWLQCGRDGRCHHRRLDFFQARARAPAQDIAEDIACAGYCQRYRLRTDVAEDGRSVRTECTGRGCHDICRPTLTHKGTTTATRARASQYHLAACAFSPATRPHHPPPARPLTPRPFLCITLTHTPNPPDIRGEVRRGRRTCLWLAWADCANGCTTRHDSCHITRARGVQQDPCAARSGAQEPGAHLPEQRRPMRSQCRSTFFYYCP